MHRRDGDQLFSCIVTGDESWVHHSTPEKNDKAWCGRSLRKVHQKGRRSQSLQAKLWLSSFGTVRVFYWLTTCPPNTTVNAAKYCEALTKLRAAIKRKHPGLLSRKVLLVHDNARPHAVRTTQTLLESFKWVIFPHPPYSLDLTPSDFHLFPALKLHLGGKHFANDDEVQAEANHWLRRQDTAWYNSGIKKLLQRYQICLDRNGGAPTCHTEAGAARDGPIGIESSHAVFTLILLLDVLDQKLMFLPLVVEFESVGNIDDLVPFLPGDIGAWIAYDLALKNSCTSSWNPKTSLKPQAVRDGASHSSPAKCELRSVIRFLNAKNNSPVEIHRQLVEVYGEKCMDIKNVWKWCREFNEGWINVHDEQRSGRPSLPESTVA
ncbi:hypothetical protein LAZ67_11002263 [Cordylochernes scorpioides]|uniref:Mos1 transposase HTH domain-containing protein n=1 Tax=Cordylochernes scorpioides TaxID=51811 RepID=A0ABY6KZ41_9ARAC|nr:hypothetical protein LAZ67_11002263 [Cordylochernes scorpioides]